MAASIGLLTYGFMALCLVLISQEALAGSKNMAVVKGSHAGESLFKTLRVYPAKVDGKALTGFLSRGPGKDVAPGRRTIVLGVKLKTGFMQAIYNGGATVKAKLRKGRTYQAVGKANGKSVRVWIKDIKTGKRASNVVKAKLWECPAVLKACH